MSVPGQGHPGKLIGLSVLILRGPTSKHSKNSASSKDVKEGGKDMRRSTDHCGSEVGESC